MSEPSLERARRELAERLRARRPEIEAAIATRIYAVAEPGERADPEYVEGLRAALAASLDYALAVVEFGEQRAPPLPTVLLAQARLAARNGVGLDTVLRRYFSGYTLFGDFVLQEAEAGTSLRGASLRRLLQEHTTQFDRLVVSVSEEYERESRGWGSPEERRLSRVQRLLAGELLDTTEFAYDFEGHHLGLVASGLSAAEAVQTLARELGLRSLLVRRDDATVWAWLGSRHGLETAGVGDAVTESISGEISLALGEPGAGLAGWRLTHRQAQAAFPLVMRGERKLVRYADVALLASILQDDLLIASLRRLYLEPLECGRDRGKAVRQTLRAYFATGRNVSSTAALLGVSRRTVTNRLRLAEENLERSLKEETFEIEVALRLEALDPGFRPEPTQTATIIRSRVAT